MRGLAAGAVMGVLLACDGESAPITPPVSGPAVALIVSPATLRLVVGERGNLTAQAFDRSGRAVRASLGWSSASPDVATVNPGDGSVVAVVPGRPSSPRLRE